MERSLVSRDPRIPPKRGLIAAHNRHGDAYGAVAVRRWLRYTRLVHKTDKIDLLAYGPHAAAFFDLRDTAKEFKVRLSLRTDASYPPERLAEMKASGLFDVFLTPRPGALYLQVWLDACTANEIPVRLMLLPPLDSDAASPEWVEALAKSTLTTAHLALSDPFLPDIWEPVADNTVDRMSITAAALEATSIEANIVGIPLCQLDDANLLRAINRPQADEDHSFYVRESYDLAVNLFGQSRTIAPKIIQILLSNHTLAKQPMDQLLLPGLIHHHYAYLFARIWRRLTIQLRLARGVPEPENRTQEKRSVQFAERPTAASLNGVCGDCGWRRICEGATPAFNRRMPLAKLEPRSGDLVVSPMHFCAKQPKHYDSIDIEYLNRERHYEEQTDEALKLISTRTPDRRFGPDDYKVENTHFDRMESGVKWWSLSNREVLSTPLAEFSLPFTISADFGAGIADFIGFSLGRHCKLLCPMEGYRHTLTLHANADGRYILLRDGRAVRPAEFKGHHFLPLRLPDRNVVRLSAWNIDECIATTNILAWNGCAETPPSSAQVKYSIIIVCTFFSRRLQAVLRNLAHQQGIDFAALEVIVAFVPGIDATDDLIDSVRQSYPHLRIVRSPFPEQYARAKGFLINESFKLAQGDWIMLLDSDTLLPPDYFSKVDAVSETAEFVAPDGRRLLNKETTHKILIGEIDPWDCWDVLVLGEGEFRFRETMGVPVGFCQCFRREHLEKHPYQEMEHFESADMFFGMEVIKDIGEATRLSGTPVLHLDHGGSQWYGAARHM